jgi:hypothetical protein
MFVGHRFLFRGIHTMQALEVAMDFDEALKIVRALANGTHPHSGSGINGRVEGANHGRFANIGSPSFRS